MKEEETTYHVPVLLKESVDAMNITPDGTYVDVTFGGEDIPAKYFRVLKRRTPVGFRSGRGCRT